MRKLPRKYECPVDNFFYDMAEKSLPFYKSLNMTPNMLTTLSLIASIIAWLAFRYDYRILAVLFLFISFYYDCVDGLFARTYNMESSFGEIYDHLTDWFGIGIIFYEMLMKDSGKFIMWSPILMIFGVAMALQVGCQEHFYNTHVDQPIIGKFKYMCPDKNLIHGTRYFGCGTFIILIAVMIMTY